MVTKKQIIEYLAQFNDDDHLELEVSSYIDGKVRCPGRDKDFGYYCCMEPGHKGRCYSRVKNVEFEPRHYGTTKCDIRNGVGRLLVKKGERVEGVYVWSANKEHNIRSMTRVYKGGDDKIVFIGRENYSTCIKWDY